MAGLADFAPEQTSHKDDPKITTNRMLITMLRNTNGRERTGAGQKPIKTKPTTIFHIAGLPETSFFGCDSGTTVGYYSIRLTLLFPTPVRRLPVERPNPTLKLDHYRRLTVVSF
jgi:hypothetical protein